ncbi:MAG: hypothetical protein WDZ91_02140 [Paenibacillaceae bacterium]
MRKLHISILFMVILLIIAPISVLAVPAELSVTAKTKLEQVISKAESKTANNLRTQINTLRAIQEQDLAWDGKIKALHYQNEADLIQARKQIKLIGAYKLNKLDSQVKMVKERYKPLFDSYSALNQQIDMARILKNKSLNSVLGTQADMMRIAVQLARKDIRSKEDMYKKAKEDNAKTVKVLREALSDIDPIKVKIKSEQSKMNTPKQHFSAEWKTLNSVIKKGDAKSIINSLKSLVTIAFQVNEHKHKIHSYEKSISDILLSVKARIP